MKINPLYSAIIAAALLSGCSSMKVSSERDQNYDFHQAQTYQWIDAPAVILESEHTHQHKNIQRALNNELSARGLTQVLTQAEASLQVAYLAKIQEQRGYTAPLDDERKVTGGVSFHRDKRNWTYHKKDPELVEYSSEVMTLVLLVYDAESARQIWRGTLETKIARPALLDEQNQLITTAANRLMEKFPLKILP